MEDGVTVAICLEKSGKHNIQEALRAFQTIRYERVCKAQGTGVSTREQWHKADWDAIREDPQSLHLKRESWLLDFDAEEHAYKVWDETIAGLRKGKKETNVLNGSVNGTKSYVEDVPKYAMTEAVGPQAALKKVVNGEST